LSLLLLICFVPPVQTPQVQQNMMEIETPASSSSTSSKTCLIVGGGLAGLATAVALRRSDDDDEREVIVLEAQSESEFYDVTQGAAVQLGANGFKALERIGGSETIEQIVRHGHVLTHIGILLPNPNNTVMVIPDTSMADTGYPQVLIRWGVLRHILQQLLPKSCIRTGVKVSEYQQSSASSAIVPIDAQGNPIVLPNQQTPSLLVAAGMYQSITVGVWIEKGQFQSRFHSHITFLFLFLDVYLFVFYTDGIDSPFYRDILGHNPNESAEPQHTIIDNGRVNIKAVVNVPLEYGNMRDAVTNHPIPRGTALTFHAPDGSVACFAGPAGPNHTYWAISIVDNDNDDNEQIDQYRGEVLKERVLHTLRELNAPQCQFVIDLIQATDAQTIYVQRSRQFDEIPSQFHYHKESSQNNNNNAPYPVVLVGDAAHAMSPSYGQAANFGFEDAATLQFCMQQSQSSLSLALECYSQLRVPRCQTMHGKSSERIAKHTKGESTQDLFKWIGSWQIDSTTTTTKINGTKPMETTSTPSPPPHSDEVMQVVA
jgi:2-polyprenyl-6-methoxyphenol hydroxylase-like FAD-dependent oxidoreductase